jgi:uroporphyrinogen decarboxylase
MEALMTPRERIVAALNREIPDRTPTDGWFHQEVQKRLKAHYGTERWEDVLQELGIEGWGECSPWIEFPDSEAKKSERPGGQLGSGNIWIDDRTHEDGWGVRHRIGEGGWYEEWVWGPLVDAETVEDVERCPLPSADQIREPEDYAGQVARLKEDGLFVNSGIPNPFKMAWMLRGMDNVLADYLINRDMLETLYDRLYALYGDMTVRAARAGVDMISITGDLAMQDRVIMGPDTWREVDKSRMAELIDDCRSVKPDVFFFIHTDGDATDLMDDLVEIGFNVINPLQPECMDPVEVKRRWGDRIALHGGISLQRTLPYGTPDEVREEVEALIRTCGYNGGLVVFPSNVVQPDTPTENIIACFHAARDFDVASLGGRPG